MISNTLKHITFELARRIERSHRYRKTVRELSQLTDRELNDLGIARGEIENVAHRALRETADA